MKTWITSFCLTLSAVASAAPAAPIPTVPVTAVSRGPVPGALICPDMDTLQALFGEYGRWIEDAQQDSMTGGQARLIRGAPTPKPDPADWHCALVKPGAEMSLEEGGTIVPIVRATFPDGHWVRGVTVEDMYRVSQSSADQMAADKLDKQITPIRRRLDNGELGFNALAKVNGTVPGTLVCDSESKLRKAQSDLHLPGCVLLPPSTKLFRVELTGDNVWVYADYKLNNKPVMGLSSKEWSAAE